MLGGGCACRGDQRMSRGPAAATTMLPAALAPAHALPAQSLAEPLLLCLPALPCHVVSCTQALGFHMGVFHVEAKYTSRGPRLIEVNARMGGGPVR